jgi:hypothetical protein
MIVSPGGHVRKKNIRKKKNFEFTRKDEKEKKFGSWSRKSVGKI